MNYAPLFFILFGIILGYTAIKWFRDKRLGCIILLLAPISSSILVAVMSSYAPERQTSTSGLDYLYAGFYTSAVAIISYLVLKLRSVESE